MMTLMVEMRGGRDEGERMFRLLESTGAQRILGYDPVPMVGRDGAPTVVLTVEVPNINAMKRIEGLPDVVAVFGDSEIEPFVR